jgi:hypothetical protein
MFERFLPSFLIWLLVNVLVILAILFLPFKRTFMVGAAPQGWLFAIVVWLLASVVACYGIESTIKFIRK